MLENQSQVTLDSNGVFLSQGPLDVYRLTKGHIHVYIVPMENGRPGRRLHYCEIRDTDRFRAVPSLCYQDSDYQYWRILIKSASEQSVLTVSPGDATEILRKNFLARRGITNYTQEGFEISLVEFYNKQITVKDGIYEKKQDRSGEKARKGVAGVLGDVFSGEGQLEHTGVACYQALQFVCQRMGMELIKGEELVTRCGRNPDVTDIAKASHLICRKILLDDGWYRSDCGGIVGTLGKETVSCVPDRRGGYLLFRSGDESITPLTPEVAEQIAPQAYSIGRTLPMGSLKKGDLFRFCRKSIQPRDLVPYLGLALACSCIGVLLPTLNRMIYDDYIPVGNVGNLTQLCLVMLTFMIGNVSFSVVKNLFAYRVVSRVGNDLQNAVYHRLFHLPESFFRRYDSADLAGRVSGIGAVASRYANALVISSLSGVFSIVYLIRMFTFSGKLTWLALGMYLVYLAVVVAITAAAARGQERIAQAESESSGKLYQYLTGVDKIRMAGVEENAVLSFMRPYARQQQEQIRLNRLVSLQETLSSVVQSVFSMVLYWYIVRRLEDTALTVGTFAAFNTAFGCFTGAVGSWVEEAMSLLLERREFARFMDIFATAPEDNDTKQIPGPLEGRLTLDHVSFSYSKKGRHVLSDLSVDIQPGEYVGIVGPSGCGKSTLLKLLLGFETPQKGMVLVDNRDLRAMNKSAYRRQLGVVLQNGKLISGSIYDNITITAPQTNMARVREVVEQVGLKEDIAQMPMGLHTMLSENCGTISGGQQQRILIARAICGNPRILIFDEATSALDNLTQAAVSKSLDKMAVTRIVVAHRLSTIQNCDRILVMNEGRLVQEGTYASLMADPEGLFYALASRQIL